MIKFAHCRIIFDIERATLVNRIQFQGGASHERPSSTPPYISGNMIKFEYFRIYFDTTTATLVNRIQFQGEVYNKGSFVPRDH